MATKPTTTKSDTTEPAAPNATPARAPKVETLFVAYQRDAEPAGFEDVVVFGRKIDAADYALEQEPAWKVLEIRKGVSLRAAISAKAGQRS